jgi:hypothetical protein
MRSCGRITAPATMAMIARSRQRTASSAALARRRAALVTPYSGNRMTNIALVCLVSTMRPVTTPRSTAMRGEPAPARTPRRVCQPSVKVRKADSRKNE